MTVYVDNARMRDRETGQRKMSNMLADSLEELHEMADKVGLKPGWLQTGSAPYYEVSVKLRLRAIKFGAMPVGPEFISELAGRWRAAGWVEFKALAEVDQPEAAKPADS